MHTYGVDDEDDLYNKSVASSPSSHSAQNADTMHVSARGDARAIQDTVKNAQANLTPATPSGIDPSLNGRVTSTKNLDDIRKTLVQGQDRLEHYQKADDPSLPFPNLAWEAVKAGLAKEAITNDQINNYVAEAEGHQKNIDDLLELNTILSAHKEGELEVSGRLKEILENLKESGIDLLSEGQNSLSKEDTARITRLAGDQISNLRSKVQILVTTKVQTLLQAMSAILEIIKDCIRQQARLVHKALTPPGH